MTCEWAGGARQRYMGEDCWEGEETAGARALKSDKFGVFMGQKEGQCGEW